MFEVLTIDDGRFNIILLVPQLNRVRKIFKFEDNLQTLMVWYVVLVSFTSSSTYHFNIPSEYLDEVASLLVSSCGISKGRDEFQSSQRSSYLWELFIEVTADYNPGLAVLDVSSNFRNPGCPILNLFILSWF